MKTKRKQRNPHPVRKVLPTVPQVRLPIGNLKRFAPGDGNPVFFSALVTRRAFLNWTEEILETDADMLKANWKEGPFTLSAAPHVGIYDYQGFPPITPDVRRRERNDPRNRVTVSLGECAGGGAGEEQDLDLGIEFACPMFGTQKAAGPITIEQALSFEEAVRAVFEAARQVGLLPIASKYRRRMPTPPRRRKRR